MVLTKEDLQICVFLNECRYLVVRLGSKSLALTVRYYSVWGPTCIKSSVFCMDPVVCLSSCYLR